jgi:membrane protein DedA with SNARE-associated domain
MIAILFLALATLASEDLTCISAGLLVRRGELHWLPAILGCFIGIYVGDLGLWLLGRLLARRMIRLKGLSRWLPQDQLLHFGTWFDRNAAVAILASRFLPGTRLPMYIAAGALGNSGARFAFWTLIAALAWTPLLIMLSAWSGETFSIPLTDFLGDGWLSLVATALIALLLLRITTLCFTAVGRAKLLARISRIWRWEFWPTWIFYNPVLFYIAWLSIRYRGFSTITAANPGIPHGGFVGESKFDILSKLGCDHVSPTILLEPGQVDSRLSRLRETNWPWPIILKPDVGQRGAGVKLVRRDGEARGYFKSNSHALIAQPYHPGPYEAGIFYYRYPNQTHGRIFSITDKRFPTVMGDGSSSLEQLIWRHSRLRMQAKTFLARHRHSLTQVPAAGEIFRLAIAGNHCQGTLFCDGSHLLTPALESAIDQVARNFDGFYFGRFDVRYSDPEVFKAGKDFTIIELNGITSESTNIYDPSWSLLRAYRTLFRQWSILFQIGAMNRDRDRRPSSIANLVQDVLRYYRGRRPSSIGD